VSLEELTEGVRIAGNMPLQELLIRGAVGPCGRRGGRLSLGRRDKALRPLIMLIRRVLPRRSTAQGIPRKRSSGTLSDRSPHDGKRARRSRDDAHSHAMKRP
jgi:hypothetical protein